MTRRRYQVGCTPPIAVGALSEAWAVFTRPNSGIVGSNPTRGMDVYVRLFCVVLFCVYVAVLRRADPPSKEPYGLCIGVRNEKSGQGLTKGCRAIDR
jgi:hypothetical protein